MSRHLPSLTFGPSDFDTVEEYELALAHCPCDECYADIVMEDRLEHERMLWEEEQS